LRMRIFHRPSNQCSIVVVGEQNVSVLALIVSTVADILFFSKLLPL
jgi:hypothetical protein